MKGTLSGHCMCTVCAVLYPRNCFQCYKEMLSNGFFSHRRFRPTSAVILPPTSEHVKVTKSSSLPYGYHRTRQHLAIDTDPNTPSLKRFTNLTNGETTRLQQKLLLENAVICDVTLRSRNAGEKKSREERGSGESDFTSFSFSSSTTLSSNSPVSRPASWTLPGDGNWTLKRHTVIDSNSEFAFMSDGGTGKEMVPYSIPNLKRAQLRERMRGQTRRDASKHSDFTSYRPNHIRSRLTAFLVQRYPNRLRHTVDSATMHAAYSDLIALSERLSIASFRRYLLRLRSAHSSKQS